MKRNCYRSHKTILSSIAMLATIVWAQGVQAATEEDLEPCINGGVSATGLYASQAEEDKAIQLAIVKNNRLARELELEPCVSGGVSASGLYVNQKAEDQVTKGHVDTEEQVAVVDDSDC